MQNEIYIAADAAEQETLEAGVYTILKRWECKPATEENEMAMQKEVFDFCRFWYIKNGRPLIKKAVRKIELVCVIPDANGKFSTPLKCDTEGNYAK